MPGQSRYRAVFFDFGGTLFSYRPFRSRFDQLLIDTAADHGVVLDIKQLRRTYARATAPVTRDFMARSSYLHRDLFGESGVAFVEALGARPRADLRDRFYAGQTSVAAPLVAPRDDASTTLSALRDLGLHIGIVSNIDDDQFGTLWERCGLDPLVDAKTTSEEAGSCKPDPAIYNHALRKADGVLPEESVFVGDSIPADVAGARALGMTTVLIVERPPSPDEQKAPDHVIESLSELLSIVRD